MTHDTVECLRFNLPRVLGVRPCLTKIARKVADGLLQHIAHMVFHRLFKVWVLASGSHLVR